MKQERREKGEASENKETQSEPRQLFKEPKARRGVLLIVLPQSEHGADLYGHKPQGT